MFVHPQYNTYNVDNDIALLKLDNPVTDDEFSTGYIRPACLAASSSETSLYPDGSCTAVGWGDTEYDGRVTFMCDRFTFWLMSSLFKAK